MNLLSWYGKHLLTIVWLPLAIDIVYPWGNPVLSVVFSGVYFAIVFSRMSFVHSYEGYGVAQEVNEIVGSILIRPVTLTASRWFPKPLLAFWGRVVLNVVVMTLTALLFVPLLGPGAWKIPFVLVAAYACAFIAEVYLWLTVNRKKLWYLRNETLFSTLSRLKKPRHELDSISATLRRDGLVR